MTFSDESLYQEVKKYFLRLELGYYVNEKKFKKLIDESNKRSKNINQFALRDALFLTNQIRKNMSEINVVDFKRIDFLSEDQLKLLLFTIGASKSQEKVSDSESDVISINQVFGLEIENLLLCKVVGDSMQKANIFEGDTLILDTKSEPTDGDIIVVNINNQTVVKKLKLNGSEIMLIPENDNFEPHIISETDTFTLIGKVKHILHTV
jgi:SOS-response transcriptional repressor LexA